LHESVDRRERGMWKSLSTFRRRGFLTCAASLFIPSLFACAPVVLSPAPVPTGYVKTQVSTNEKNYHTYLEKLEEARISDDLNRQKIANISVTQPPVAPQKQKKLLNITLGVVLGPCAGLGYAFFSEYTSQRFSMPEQVERRLGLPVLTSIALKGKQARTRVRCNSRGQSNRVPDWDTESLVCRQCVGRIQ